MHPFNYVLAGLLGSLLGVAELLARYRDRPWRLVSQGAAWFYVMLNAGASVVALVLIDIFGWNFGQDGSTRAATQVLVAGLGSAVLFRSSLFLVKVGDENVGMGPSLILTNVLAAADRSVDRDQATERLRDVGEIMDGIDFSKAAEALVAACLAAAANVPPQAALDLRESVDALAASSANNHSKVVTLGILIIDVVGAGVLRQAVSTLGDAIKVS